MILEALAGIYLVIYGLVSVAFVLAYFLILRRLDPSAKGKWYPRLIFLTLVILGVPLVSTALPDALLVDFVGPYEVPEPPAAWLRHKGLVFDVHSLPAAACEPVSPIGIITPMQGVPLERMAGTYALTVIANPPTTSDTLSIGYLWLEPTDERHCKILDIPGITFPLYGATSIDLEGIGEAGFLYRLSSSDPDLPGVQATYKEDNGELTFVLGAATTKRGFVMGAGVLFTVQEVDRSGFYGSWTGAGASGYYCARRFSTEYADAPGQ